MVKEVISRSLERGETALLEEGYEKGMKEGVEQGRMAEHKAWEMKNAKIKIDEGMQMEPTTRITTDLSTQMTTSTAVDAVIQTAPNDERPRLLNDTGHLLNHPTPATQPHKPAVKP